MKNTNLWIALTIIFGLSFGLTLVMYNDTNNKLETSQKVVTQLENQVKSETALRLANQNQVTKSNQQTLKCSEFVVDTIDIVLKGNVDNLIDHLRSFDMGEDLKPIY